MGFIQEMAALAAARLGFNTPVQQGLDTSAGRVYVTDVNMPRGGYGSYRRNKKVSNACRAAGRRGWGMNLKNKGRRLVLQQGEYRLIPV